jgi:hypothetical protein
VPRGVPDGDAGQRVEVPQPQTQLGNRGGRGGRPDDDVAAVSGNRAGPAPSGVGSSWTAHDSARSAGRCAFCGSVRVLRVGARSAGRCAEGLAVWPGGAWPRSVCLPDGGRGCCPKLDTGEGNPSGAWAQPVWCCRHSSDRLARETAAVSERRQPIDLVSTAAAAKHRERGDRSGYRPVAGPLSVRLVTHLGRGRSG